MRRYGWLSLLFLILGASSGVALTREAFEREIQLPYLQTIQTAPVVGSAIREWAAYHRRQWEAYDAVAKRIVSRYQQVGWNEEYANEMAAWCEGYREICRKESYALRALIVKTVRQKLSVSRSPSIHRLLKDNRVLTRLRILTIGDSDGGLFRGDGHVFLNLLAVPPDELPLLYLHELLHVLDRRLREATRTYLDGEEMIRYFQQHPDLKDPSQLPAAKRQYLRDWLRAGLDCGLLAEWRAWTPTVHIYLEGKREGLWGPIPRVEEILAKRAPGDSLGQTVFRFLDPRFKSPNTRLFAVPLVHNLLSAQRADLKTAKEKLSGGNLETLVPFTWPD